MPPGRPQDIHRLSTGNPQAYPQVYPQPAHSLSTALRTGLRTACPQGYPQRPERTETAPERLTPRVAGWVRVGASARCRATGRLEAGTIHGASGSSRARAGCRPAGRGSRGGGCGWPRRWRTVGGRSGRCVSWAGGRARARGEDAAGGRLVGRPARPDISGGGCPAGDCSARRQDCTTALASIERDCALRQHRIPQKWLQQIPIVLQCICLLTGEETSPTLRTVE